MTNEGISFVVVDVLLLILFTSFFFFVTLGTNREAGLSLLYKYLL